MKDYQNKKETIEVPVPAPAKASPAATAATIDAMLDKMAGLIKERNQWMILSRLLLMKSRWEDLDEETRAAFAVCYPEANS